MSSELGGRNLQRAIRESGVGMMFVIFTVIGIAVAGCLVFQASCHIGNNWE
jgi:hypothetical protein